MPLLEEKNTHHTNKTEQGLENQNNQKPNSLITTIGQLLPFAPIVYEQFTGQKVPQMTGTIAEMQMTLINIQSNLQTIANNQQTLSQRLIALETKLLEIQTNANNHLTNLTNQFKSLRLTHTKEHKQIEFDPDPNKLEENY